MPESLVGAEFDSIWSQFEEQRKQNPEAAQKEYGEKSDDDIKAELRGIAQRRIRLGLVLAEVGRTNKIQISQDDINRAIVAEARRYRARSRRSSTTTRRMPRPWKPCGRR